MPTWRGWLLLLLVFGTAAVLFVRNVYWFLAVNDPKPGGFLVIEGWSPDYVLEWAVADFRKSNYRKICLTGGPIEFGNAMREHRTYAEYAKAMCLKLGLAEDVLQALPARAVERDRSYASAIALRDWLRGQGMAEATINIAGNGPHSRRTRLVYEKALGPKVRVGISNAEERTFDPNRWWASSGGFRVVVDEWIAYCYARFFFHPPQPQP